MTILWLMLVTSFGVTSGVATQTYDDFKTMVLEKLQTVETSYTELKTSNTKLDQKYTKLDQKYTKLEQKFTTLEQKYAKLDRKYAELESENKQLRQKISPKSPIRRQLRYTPEQEVAFSARVAQHLKNLTAHQTIVFGTTLTNIGSFYNNHTGVFYVPVSGTYLLFANILSEAGNRIETELIADGNLLAEIYSGGQFHGAGSNLVIAHLEQGTNVWVKVHNHYSSDMSVHCCWSTFSGYLLRESFGDPQVVVG